MAKNRQFLTLEARIAAEVASSMEKSQKIPQFLTFVDDFRLFWASSKNGRM